MTLKRIRVWVRKHWFILINRPTNGHYSLEELDATLLEINANTKRVCRAIEKMKKDTTVAERMMKENVPSTDHS